MTCSGTGFSGDIGGYLELEASKEPFINRGFWSLRENSVRLQREEEKFYRNPKMTPALEAAIFALESWIKGDKTQRTMACDIIPFSRNKIPRGVQKMSTVNLQVSQAKSVPVVLDDVNDIMEKVLIAGDLSKMEPKDRIKYYLQTCNSLGMNPMTKPFDLITLNGKMVLYPNRSGTDQLRKIGNVDTEIVSKGFDKDTGCYVVTARAKLPSGRTDEDMGIVCCVGLKGDSLANAQLKAMTKAKRRVTLSIMGLGWVDESEVSSISNAKTHKLDLDTGSVIDVSDNQKKEIGKQIDDSLKKPVSPSKPSAAQIARMFAIAKDKGMHSKDELKNWIGNTFNFNESFSLTGLTQQEYEDICKLMESMQSEKPPAIVPASAPTPVVNETELPWTKYLDDPMRVK